MPRNSSFWRNVAIIGVAHVVVLTGLLRWNATAKKPLSTDIVWMEGGAVAGAPSAASFAQDAAETPTPAPTEEPTVPPMEDPLTMRTPPPDDAELDTPTPKPTATAQPTSTPKTSPKPTAKPTPKKAVIAKAAPKPNAAPKKFADAKKVSVKPVQRKTSDSTQTTASDSSGGSGGRSDGPGGASQFGWYGKMLHNRFFSEWIQPKGLTKSGAKISAQVRVRIEKDGRVSDFNIVRSSGNVVIDESLNAVAKRVTQVDPLPAGLADAGHYDVNINFELNAD
jgi:TonB family protein